MYEEREVVLAKKKNLSQKDSKSSLVASYKRQMRSKMENIIPLSRLLVFQQVFFAEHSAHTTNQGRALSDDKKSIRGLCSKLNP
jgi:hypothetical protein